VTATPAPVTVSVTTPSDLGPGSLRAAFEAASADPRIGGIRLDERLGSIALATPLVLSAAQPIEIDGNGAVVEAAASGIGSAAAPLRGAIVSNGGGDLTIRGLTVRGSAGVGILVHVPADRGGELAVTLERVAVEGSRLQGVLVNDQAAYFADHETQESGGSSASVRVVLRVCRLVRNGWGGLDNDGLRVNEGGAGSLHVAIDDTIADGNGGEGIELDERGTGDAIVVVRRTSASDNGALTTEDLDDGIDIDETGPGGIEARFVDVSASRNAQQGVELNENNLGDLDLTMTRVTADDNGAEGIEVEEDDHAKKHPGEPWGGDLNVSLTDVSASRNGRDGERDVDLREKADGELNR